MKDRNNTHGSDSDKKGKNEKKKGFMYKFKNNKKFRITVIATFLIAILGVSVLGSMYVLGAFSPKVVKVPDLVGVEKEEAERMLTELKLELEVEEEVFDNEKPAGFIVSQDPEANSEIKQKNKVKVKVSKGPEEVKVPNFVGMNIKEVRELVASLGLLLDETREFSSKVEKDYVIKQDVKANETIGGGSEIKIVVSDGKEIKKAKVPDVVGKTEEEARRLISDSKLLVKEIIYVQDTSRADATVVNQDIVAGDEVDELTPITLTVNRLPKTEKSVQVTITLSNSLLNNTEETGAFTIIVRDNSGDKTFNESKGGVINTTSKGTGSGTIKIIFKKGNTVINEVVKQVDYDSGTSVYVQ